MLVLEETLYFYDEPLLATFKDRDGKLYVGVKVFDEEQDYQDYDNPYLVTPINPENYQGMIDNRIKLYDVFLRGGEWKMINHADEINYQHCAVDREKAEIHFPGNAYLTR